VYPIDYIIHTADFSIHVPAGEQSISAYRKNGWGDLRHAQRVFRGRAVGWHCYRVRR